LANAYTFYFNVNEPVGGDTWLHHLARMTARHAVKPQSVTSTLKFLFIHGARTDLRDDEGGPALHKAVRLNSYMLGVYIDLMKEHKQDFTVKDSSGLTAYQLARQFDPTSSSQAKKSVASVGEVTRSPFDRARMLCNAVIQPNPN
jgi:hypothetical protein